MYTALWVLRLVSDTMGGTVARDDLDRFMWEIHLSELKLQLQSNVIPIGRIKKGTFYHRALLFKVPARQLYFWPSAQPCNPLLKPGNTSD